MDRAPAVLHRSAARVHSLSHVRVIVRLPSSVIRVRPTRPNLGRRTKANVRNPQMGRVRSVSQQTLYAQSVSSERCGGFT